MLTCVSSFCSAMQLNGILQIQSGSPFTPSLPGDPARVGSRYLPRWDRICDGNLPSSEQSVSRFFDTGCFATPRPGVFGNSARTVIIGPGFTSTDFSLFRNITLTERAKLQFRAEVFNALNNSNYDQPGARPGFTFGKVLTEKHAREIQLGLRMKF